jgi:hypothetical protein
MVTYIRWIIDALSICMNTVAIFFIFDLDSLLYSHGISSKERTRFEASHHIYLTPAQVV